MKSLSSRRLRLTTEAEKKLCFSLQALVWYLNGAVRFQRERTVHIADMLSRSLDFYFAQGKLGVELDGRSHDGIMQAAKDEWTDKLLLDHDRILVLRFRNRRVMENVHEVIGQIARQLKARHSWPVKILKNFDYLIACTESPDSWLKFTSEFLDARRKR